MLFIFCCLISGVTDYTKQVLLLLTDAGSPMIKMGDIMTERGFDKTLKLLCVAHALNNVADTIRKCEEYKPVNDVIMKVKKIFTFSRSRHSVLEGFKLKKPPAPVMTRWGTWLNSVPYYTG